MTRFNQPPTPKSKSVGPGKVHNYEGGEAYRLPPEVELYSLASTTFLKDSFYESGDDRLERLRGLVSACDLVFVAKLAVYVRTVMHLRTVAHVLAVEAIRRHSATMKHCLEKGIETTPKKLGYRPSMLASMVRQVCVRADDMTEILAYFVEAEGRGDAKVLNNLPNQLIEGLGRSSGAFARFDEYALAKYDRAGAVTLRDAMFLTHPKPRDEEQGEVFGRLAQGKLEVPFTWEVELSRLGQEKYRDGRERMEAFRAKWEELIDRTTERGYPVLGYMALLRNLRNIVEAGVRVEQMEKVCARISDPEGVKRSKQLPFRFFSAYKMLHQTGGLAIGPLLAAVDSALMESAGHMPFISDEDKVLVACDISGSMGHSTITPTISGMELGLILGVALTSRAKWNTLGLFTDTWSIAQIPKGTVVLESVLRICNSAVPRGTRGDLPLRYAIENPQHGYNRIFYFTDGQVWRDDKRGADAGYMSNLGFGFEHCTEVPQLWNEYRGMVPSAKLILVDVRGYGNTPLEVNRGQGVYFVSGWSNRIFDALEAMDKGDTIQGIIESVTLDQ